MNLRASRGLTLVLGGVCAFLLLLVVLFWFGLGRGYAWWPLDPVDAAASKKNLANPQFRLGAWENFAEVNKRPLFNEDRKPTPPMPAEAPTDQKPIKQLDVVLSGVIITPKVRMALVKEKGKEKAMTVKEGGAMPGDWSSWSLAEVKPRGAVFKNSAGESATVELIPVASSQKPTPPPPPHVPQPAAAAGAPPGQPPVAAPPSGQPPQVPNQPGPAPDAATDLQQRIEARRQQIREQQQQQQQPPQGQSAEPPQHPQQQQ